MLTHPGKPITIYNIAAIAGVAYSKAFVPANIQSGFRVNGVFPSNKYVLCEDEFLVSMVTNEPAPGESDSDTAELVADLPMVDSGDEEHDATTLTPNDYVMLMSKKATSHFVGMIVKNTDEFTNEFEVTFPKCSKKSASVRRGAV